VAFLYLNASELQITKYITNQKPKIYLEYVNSSPKLIHMLQIDTTIISHYDMKIGEQTKNLTNVNITKYKGYNYLLRINYQNKILTALLYNLVNKIYEVSDQGMVCIQSI
jgi:hypothetical protein